MEAAVLDPAPPQIDTDIRGVRALLDRSEFAPALQLALRLQPQAPQNRDLLYMIAVAQRYLQRIPDALATLGRLEEHHPDYPRLYQERGHCYVAQRSATPAIAAFEQAVKMSPALPASWQALQILYRMTGQLDAAKKAAAEVDNLAKLPPDVVTAFSMLRREKLGSKSALIIAGSFMPTSGE